MKGLGYVTAFIVLIIYSTLLGGWTLSYLWSWFIVPTFDLAALTIPQALGLSMVVTYMTHDMYSAKEKDDIKTIGDALIKGFLIATGKPVMALLFGLVIKQWM